MKRISIAFAAVLVAGTLYGQNVGIKTNLFYGAFTLTPNLGVEFAISDNMSVDISAGYNPWNLRGTAGNNRKTVHYSFQPEFRYWFCDKFNGHFLGAHLLFSQYNISERELPLLFGKGSEDYRHEGWGAGVGLTYGYQFILSPRWVLEASVGLGYSRLKYDRYDCVFCGDRNGETVAGNYFGPTKLAISIMYMIK